MNRPEFAATNRQATFDCLFFLLFDNSVLRCVALMLGAIRVVKLKVYQKLVVVVGWLGVSLAAGMRPGLQVSVVRYCRAHGRRSGEYHTG